MNYLSIIIYFKMTSPVKSLIPLKDSTRDQKINYTGKYTGILDQEEQVSYYIYCGYSCDNFVNIECLR